MQKTKIVLASTSIYRQMQLKEMGVSFSAIRPKVDEESLKLKKLSPRALSRYLSLEKAKSLVNDHPDSIIIGGDQLVNFKGQILGKPGHFNAAKKMLTQLQDQEHELITSICVVFNESYYYHTVTAKIKMRKLSKKEISDYLLLDQPYDSAGSYKFEKAGFLLIDKIRVSDPSSLIGLPKMGLFAILRKLKYF